MTTPSPIEATLVLTQGQYEEIAAATTHELESAAALLGSVLQTPEVVKFLVTDVVWVPQEAYLRRHREGLSIASFGYVPALANAAERGLSALWFHTHPGPDGWPIPSPFDRIVDGELESVFRIRTGSDFYGHVVASPRPHSIAFSGALDDTRSAWTMTRVVAVGSRLVVVPACNASGQDTTSGPHDAEDLFSRNVAAFGGAVQSTLGQLRVAVVGAGGTGSSVAEQLVRLGVRNLLLVDPDDLEESNVTRVYGSTPGDVGAAKVDVLAAHLRRIAPEVEVSTIAGSVNTMDVARRVSGRDVVFGCTDDNSGRMVLARLAFYARALVIDCGVLLSTDSAGRLSGIDGRVTTMRPGAACLLCRGRIDLARAAAEQMSHEQHQRLAAEGYSPQLPGVQPAVVPFTTMVAAQAVTELLEALTGFGPPDQGTEVLLRVHDREVSTNAVAPRPGHFCHPDSAAVECAGHGPFLGKMWPA